MRTSENATVSQVGGDFESRSEDTDHDDLRLWLRMMATHKLVTNELRRRFRTTFDMSLARFDLMAQLESTTEGLRMGEITNRLMVTTGNTTGLVDELEADGLIERMPDPRSRRANLVRLTPKGRKAFRAAAKAHEDWMTEFFSALSSKDKKMMFEILGRQKAFVLSRIQSAEKTAAVSRNRPRRGRSAPRPT